MKKCPLILFVILLTLFFVGNSNAAKLTFEDLGPNYTQISDDYGDITGLNISYALRDGFGDTDYIEYIDGKYSATVNYWETGYGDLTDVAWAGSNDSSQVAEITFDPSDGNSATITGFDLGFWKGGSYATEVRIYNHDYSQVFSTGSFIGTGGASHSSFESNITGNATLHLQWLYPFYAAIDNVEYDVSFVSDTSGDNPGPGDQLNPVPEPTTILLSGLGLLGMGVLLRRKKVSK